MGNCFVKNEKSLKESVLKSSYSRPESKAIKEKVNKLSNATMEVRRLYNVKDTLLGAGAFGKVFLAESKENPDVKFAIKVL